MIRYLSIVPLIFLAGCTPNHYITNNGEAVAIYLDSPKANEVLFASSADNFSVHAAQKEVGGLWVINNFADREFSYFYVVDGKMYVPECRYREKDDFGTINCIYQP